MYLIVLLYEPINWLTSWESNGLIYDDVPQHWLRPAVMSINIDHHCLPIPISSKSICNSPPYDVIPPSALGFFLPVLRRLTGEMRCLR